MPHPPLEIYGELAIHPSRKSGIVSREQFIAAIDNWICLRVVGDGKRYAVMTPTANEDDGRFLVPHRQDILLEVAAKTAEELGGNAEACEDHQGRHYLRICHLNDNDDLELVCVVFSRLLRQAIKVVTAEACDLAGLNKELIEIYDAIAPDESGEPAYLVDGVYLDSSGRLIDQGR